VWEREREREKEREREREREREGGRERVCRCAQSVCEPTNVENEQGATEKDEKSQQSTAPEHGGLLRERARERRCARFRACF